MDSINKSINSVKTLKLKKVVCNLGEFFWYNNLLEWTFVFYLSLGVLICLDRVSIETLDLDTGI